MNESQNCIFCSIVSGQIPSKKIAENEHVIVVQDIAPKAPVHYLIIPKKHIADIASLEDANSELAGQIMLMARDLSQKLSGSQAFRLIINNGADVGQTVFHLHVHFLSGKTMADF